MSWMNDNGCAYVLTFLARISPHNCNSMQRFLFLESIAGVPGMVAATLRHLRSLRLLVSRPILRIFLSGFSDNLQSVVTPDGSIPSWKKPRTNGCTSCTFAADDPAEHDDVNSRCSRTFLALRKPGLFFRAMLIGAQGVFYNTFCACPLFVTQVLRADRNSVLCYMLSPRTCHRFVGHLEEEAVIT